MLGILKKVDPTGLFPEHWQYSVGGELLTILKTHLGNFELLYHPLLYKMETDQHLSVGSIVIATDHYITQLVEQLSNSLPSN